MSEVRQGNDPAFASALSGGLDGQASRPGSGEGLKCPPADADIFDALFSKWGKDDEANMGGSFDDLLWEEGAAAVAAAAASMGWQRTATPGAHQLSKPSAVEQSQQAWTQAGKQQQQQQNNLCSYDPQQLLYGASVAASPRQKPVQQDCSGVNRCGLGQLETSRGAQEAEVAGGRQDVSSCEAALQQLQYECLLQASGIGQSAPMQGANAATGAAVCSAHEPPKVPGMLSPQLGSLQHASGSVRGSSAAVDGSKLVHQLSLQSVLEMQQQLMTQVPPAPSLLPAQQQEHLQQVPASLNSLFSYQLHAQQSLPSAAPAAANTSWLPGGLGAAATAAAANGLGGSNMQPGGCPGAMDTAAAAFALQNALQQQQQQLMRPAGLPMGLPFPGAGPGPGPGFGLLNNTIPLTVPFGVPPSAAGALFGPAAMYASAAATAAAAAMAAQAQMQAAQPPPQVFGAQQLWQQAMQQQALQQQATQLHQTAQPCSGPGQFQQQQLQRQGSLEALQMGQQRLAAGVADGRVGGNTAGPPSTPAAVGSALHVQPFTAMLGSAAFAPGPAAAAAAANRTMTGGAGLMGPPPPHAPPTAVTNMTSPATAQAAAGIGNSSLLQQLPGQLGSQLSQLPAELLSALGLGQTGGATAAPLVAPGLATLPPLFPGIWPLHLAGLLRPPPVQSTNVLQLAMMMQSAMQASALQGGGETQQAAMVVAALQGLAANMRMFMPWTNMQAPWQQRPAAAQHQGPLNANGGIARQLSSSYGAGGQKATLQFGSQLQTSTTDISGQAALPGCHSHLSAVAAAAAAGTPIAGLVMPPAPAGTLVNMGGMMRLDSMEKLEAPVKAKQKRKHRANEHKGRHDRRKIRANNRVRVKGRFVKMGPDGPILPGSAEANEQHHSEHDGSDAELTDQETLDYHGSSSGRVEGLRPGTADAAARPEVAAGVGVLEFGTAQAGADELQLAFIDDEALHALPQAVAAQGITHSATGCFHPVQADREQPGVLQNTDMACCAQAICNCQGNSPVEGRSPLYGQHAHQAEEQQQLLHLQGGGRGAAAGCAGPDKALGDAVDGPCGCDSPVCSFGDVGLAAAAPVTGVSSVAAQQTDACCAAAAGSHDKHLVRYHSNKSTADEGVEHVGEDLATAAVLAVGFMHDRQQVRSRSLDSADMAATVAGGAAHDEPSSKRQKLDQGQQQHCAAQDAAEAAAMPVPESNMPQAPGLVEQGQVTGLGSLLQPCEVEGCTATVVSLPLQAGIPALAAVAAGCCPDVDGEMPDISAVLERDTVDVGQQQGMAGAITELQHVADALPAAVVQSSSAAAADPGSGCVPVAQQLRSAPAAQPPQSAVVGLDAAAPVNQPPCTQGVQHIEYIHKHPAACQPQHQLPGQFVPPHVEQPSLWGPALGFRAWGAARPAAGNAGLSLDLQPSAPLPLHMSAAAAPAGGAVGETETGSAAAVASLAAQPSMPFSGHVCAAAVGVHGVPAAAAIGMPPPAAVRPTAALAAVEHHGSAAVAARAAGLMPLLTPPAAPASSGSFYPWPQASGLMGPPAPLTAAAAVGLPLGVARPVGCSPAPAMHVLGGQLMLSHVSQLLPLHGGCWPLVAAAVGGLPAAAQKQPRQRRRGQAGEESEQTDSCHK